MIRALARPVLRLAAALTPLALLAGCITINQPARPGDDELAGGPTARSAPRGQGYSEGEVATAVSNWLGVSAEVAAALVERIFYDLGRPNAVIEGSEGAFAVGAGLRYGDGTLIMQEQQRHVFWQGPSIGFDIGGNASRTFILVYNLERPDDIYRRFPGVEGSAYFIGGIGVNYQRADNIILAPIRVGVGFREGVSVGYLSYSRQRNVLPF